MNRNEGEEKRDVKNMKENKNWKKRNVIFRN
jgi:hypothetical protein